MRKGDSPSHIKIGWGASFPSSKPAEYPALHVLHSYCLSRPQDVVWYMHTKAEYMGQQQRAMANIHGILSDKSIDGMVSRQSPRRDARHLRIATASIAPTTLFWQLLHGQLSLDLGKSADISSLFEVKHEPGRSSVSSGSDETRGCGMVANWVAVRSLGPAFEVHAQRMAPGNLFA